jgi:hypothetical protein
MPENLSHESFTKPKKCVITGCTNTIYRNYTICESHAGKLKEA